MNRNIFIAELTGTFMLVFAGTGAIIADTFSGGALGHVGISLVFGFTVLAVIYAVGDISGAHLNPAVTMGFLAAGRISLRDASLYVISQMVGAVLASLLLLALFPDASSYGETVSHIGPLRGFAMETVISFMLMFVIINVATGAREKGIIAGLAIGLTVALAALMAGPFTGASMNPARSLGPALVSGVWTHFWIYLTAPPLGAVLAVLVYGLVAQKE